MRYPPAFVDRVRQHFRLSEIVGQRVSLRRAGREFSGLCPFHNEKSPSFTVNDEKGFFHCFGCGAHGDAIGFIADIDGIGYREAIETLARQAGIDLPKPTRAEAERYDRLEHLHACMEAAATWFSLQMRQSAGEEARHYLAKRGLTDETIREFRIGFAPARFTGLKDAMLRRGFGEALLIEAGLLARSETRADSYDKFRNRIIFPINDGSGRCIAFGGRTLDPDAKGPKYLNSPDTPLFHKGRTLYRYDIARKTARDDGLILAEGYMDVIALAQAGMPQAVAPLGTAVTREQLAMAWQVADEPVVCLDGDTAGARAMERVVDLALPLLKPGKSLRFVRLPAGEDPDSLLRSHGAESLRRLLGQGAPLVDLLWQRHAGKAPTPEQAAAREQQLMQSVERIEDRAVREQYRSTMRDRLYEQNRPPRRVRTPGPPRSGSARFGIPKSDKPSLGLPLLRGRQLAREECYQGLLALAGCYPAMLDEGLDEQLAAARFQDAAIETLRDRLVHLHGSGQALSNRAEVAEALPVELAERMVRDVIARQLPKNLRLPDESEGLPLARLFRNHLTKRLELLHLEDEYEAAEERLARTMEERDRKRLDMLRAQVQALRHHQDFFPDRETFG